MRHDEAAGLRWRDVGFRAEPLPRIQLTHQAGDRPLKEDKHATGKRREVPMHPTLRAVLEAWRRGGFARFHGRHPRPDDYLVPSVANVHEFRVSRTTHKQIARDCVALGIRPRTVHELRNTFVQLASMDAPELEAVVATITHSVKPVAGAFNTYRGSRWLAACAVMSRLDVRLERHAAVVTLSRAAGDADGAPRAAATMPSSSGVESVGSSIEGPAGGTSGPASSDMFSDMETTDAKNPVLTRGFRRSGRDSNPRPPA